MKYTFEDRDKLPNDCIYYSHRMEADKLNSIIELVGVYGVSIHANIQTIVSTYVNRFYEHKDYSNIMQNLHDIVEEKDRLRVLSEIYNGTFDLLNRGFWHNKNTLIPIIIDDDVENGETLLIKNDILVGYIRCE